MKVGYIAVRSAGKVLGKVKVVESATLKELVEKYGESKVTALAIRMINTDASNQARSRALGKTGTAKPKADLSQVKEIAL